MIPRRLSDVARAVEGVLLGDDAEVTGVAIHTDDVGPGILFVALPGERVDGARFVPEAVARAAAGVLVREGVEVDGPAVSVSSTLDALGRLAADERRRMAATVVGITGANGKTTTKDMAGAVLSTRLRTHVSPGSFNNEIGLPVTLLGAGADAEAVVAELGARHVGDVAILCEIARPTVIVVTNVGVAHLEIFGSWDRIVEASAEPVEALGADGVAILSADDPVVVGFVDRCAGRVVTFGLGASADVRAEGIELEAEGCASFRMTHAGKTADVTLGVAGEHMVANALAAAAVGTTLGVPLDVAADALRTASVSPWRMETFTTPDGIRVVNDAYNANPESMAAALRTARRMAAGRRLVAVLGSMAELGPISLAEHERLGELAARIRVDRLITVGEESAPIAASAVREGMLPEDVVSYDDPESALADVRRSAAGGDLVLVKGSRVVGLERLAEALR